MVHWAGQNIMQYVLNFKKGVAHMSILLYGFSVHQIFRIRQPTSTLLRKQINAQLPNHLNDSELFELVKTYQVHTHSRTCWKYNKNECHFSHG